MREDTQAAKHWGAQHEAQVLLYTEARNILDEKFWMGNDETLRVIPVFFNVCLGHICIYQEALSRFCALDSAHVVYSSANGMMTEINKQERL